MWGFWSLILHSFIELAGVLYVSHAGVQDDALLHIFVFKLEFEF